MIIRIMNDALHEEVIMDYLVNAGDISILVEQKKVETKNRIIDQYIALRKKKGYSQEKIAELTGIARTNIVRIESKMNVPTIEVLLKLATALDMNLEINFVEK